MLYALLTGEPTPHAAELLERAARRDDRHRGNETGVSSSLEERELARVFSDGADTALKYTNVYAFSVGEKIESLESRKVPKLDRTYIESALKSLLDMRRARLSSRSSYTLESLDAGLQHRFI